MLKIEGQARRVILRGAKHYTFGSDTKIKGIKRGTKKIKMVLILYIHFPGFF